MKTLEIALATVVATLPVLATAEDTTTIRMGLTSNQSMAYAPAAMLNLDEEIQAKHGIDFEAVDFAGNFQGCIAVAMQNEIDGCLTGPTIGMNAMAEGANLKGFYNMIGQTGELTVSNAAAERAGVTADAPLSDRVKALDGMRIAQAGPGTSHDFVLNAVMATEGMTTDDMNYQILTDLTAMNAGVMHDRLDGAFWSAGGMSPVQSQGIARVWISMEDLPGMATLPNVSAFATPELIEEKREGLQRVKNALVDVVAELNEDMMGYSEPYRQKYYDTVDIETYKTNLSRNLVAYTKDQQGTAEDWDFWVDRLSENSDLDFSNVYHAEGFVTFE